MKQQIREYDCGDEDAVRQLYWETAQQHRNRHILDALLRRRGARRTWQAGLVGLLSLHLANDSGRALLMLELALWSAGVGVGWYMWIRNEWQRQVAKHSAWMAERLQEIKQSHAKNNAWEEHKKKNELVGAVALEYQQEEHEGRIRNLTGVESKIELALVRTVIEFARRQDIKVIAKSGDDTNALHNLQIPPHEPIHHLFSPTTLANDLSYLTSLTRLTLLDLSHNRLETLPSSIRQLKHLRQLNLAHNRLAEIPNVIPSLKKLTYLDLSYNMFSDVPLSLSMLKHLSYLDLSYSRIDAVPAELLRLSIATIKTEGCPQLQEKVEEFTHSLAHNPPSLAEICARQLAPAAAAALPRGKHKKQKKKATQQEPQRDLPDHLQNYLGQSKACFYCGESYFDNPVIRYRIVQQHDGSCIPVRYNLCSAHWSDDQDRLLALFSRNSS
ncbi:hypothetical protein BDB00DRAFT_761845 [Zychaea mexicana]|uniref:uncharacterized protein n=1 Tax=Zychaea mexicana TaxID=64656 RepID=UPI0022FEE424|nr:uncharacterized protein BDB00DRAFT_761845 [Zychaea mexicana]KAI9494448.1 hypothetical protein BDB00DRAFT_761845 [Zychaea mexicana]